MIARFMACDITTRAVSTAHVPRPGSVLSCIRERPRAQRPVSRASPITMFDERKGMWLRSAGGWRGKTRPSVAALPLPRRSTGNSEGVYQARYRSCSFQRHGSHGPRANLRPVFRPSCIAPPYALLRHTPSHSSMTSPTVPSARGARCDVCTRVAATEYSSGLNSSAPGEMPMCA
jgi:hypothetical protein